jgi:hypothetical protein
MRSERQRGRRRARRGKVREEGAFSFFSMLRRESENEF